jgi:succinate dehydrogenase/fumarate reductase iron-sulfur protein
MEKTIKVTVERFDPDVDQSPHYQTYEVPLVPRMTILDTLDYIYEKVDPSLAYHSHTACHRRICARCNVRIDDRAGLSCHTEVTGDVTIRPLPKHKVIRDLVVEGI